MTDKDMDSKPPVSMQVDPDVHSLYAELRQYLPDLNGTVRLPDELFRRVLRSLAAPPEVERLKGLVKTAVGMLRDHDDSANAEALMTALYGVTADEALADPCNECGGHGQHKGWCSEFAAPPVETQMGDLLRRCKYEMQNLCDKLTKGEHQGWEGSRRRTLLAMEIDAALAASPSAPQAVTEPITQNDKRWRFLEHGCQWVSWTPINGRTRSFDPRNLTGYEGDLSDMRASADEELATQLKTLRDAALPHDASTPPNEPRGDSK